MKKPVLNTELILEEPSQIADGGGGYDVVWQPVGTLWAEINSASARERRIGGRVVSELSHEIVVRGAPLGSPRRPSPDCRFRSGERVFAIRGVADADQRGRYLTVWAEEAMAV